MVTRILKGQGGFTLIELLAVIAILTVLSGIVAGAVTGIGASGQSARLVGDADTIGKSADRFFNDAFPQSYPVLTCCGTGTNTPEDITTAGGDLGVRLVDFEAVLPGDPTKSFTPDFLKEVPDTAALVSWRIVTATGQVFFAQDGAQLVRPSNARLDVKATDTAMSTADDPVTSDYTFKLRMNKNEAGLETLGISIPAGYAIGGQSVADDTVMGTYSGKLSTDNPWSPGQVLAITGTLKATGSSNEWELFVDYPAVVNNHPTLARHDRTHKVSIATPSEEAAGALKIDLAPNGDKAHNQSTETWELTINGTVNGTNVITNPSVKGVYRWLGTQHTRIDVTDLFSGVTGNQAVVIKESTS
jgi:prepilin-type N-terminal cleavage/methylation domain-containing protein